MAGKRGFFDLKSQFIFYASYHNQPVNVIIHLFCIWQLVLSAIALMQVRKEILAFSCLYKANKTASRTRSARVASEEHFISVKHLINIQSQYERS